MTTITVNSVATKAITTGATLTIWKTGYPETVSTVIAGTVTGAAGSDQVITLPVTTPTGGLLPAANMISTSISKADIDAGLVQVAVQQPISATYGNTVNYVTAQILRVDRPTKRPLPLNAWKCLVTSGTDFTVGADDFGSIPLELEVLVPSAADYATGGPLEQVVQFINAGMSRAVYHGFADSAPPV